MKINPKWELEVLLTQITAIIHGMIDNGYAHTESETIAKLFSEKGFTVDFNQVSGGSLFYIIEMPYRSKADD